VATFEELKIEFRRYRVAGAGQEVREMKRLVFLRPVIVRPGLRVRLTLPRSQVFAAWGRWRAAGGRVGHSRGLPEIGENPGD
jgi:hypothetical protein